MRATSVLNGEAMRELTNGRRFAVTAAVAAILAFGAGAAGGHARKGLWVGVLLAAVGLLGLVPGELHAIRRPEADERQRELLLVSLVASDQIVRAVAVVGVLVEVHRGQPGAFVLMAVVGAAAEALATLVTPRLR